MLTATSKEFPNVNLLPRLTLIWVGFVGIRFEVGEVKVPPRLKLVRIVLGT